MRRVIVGGMLAIVLLYAGANVGYFYALPVEAMAARGGRRAAADHGRPPGPDRRRAHRAPPSCAACSAR